MIANLAAICVVVAWLALLSDSRSHAPAFFLGLAAVLAVIGKVLEI